MFFTTSCQAELTTRINCDLAVTTVLWLLSLTPETSLLDSCSKTCISVHKLILPSYCTLLRFVNFSLKIWWWWWWWWYNHYIIDMFVPTVLRRHRPTLLGIVEKTFGIIFFSKTPYKNITQKSVCTCLLLTHNTADLSLIASYCPFLICYRPFSTINRLLAENHRSLIQIYITSSLESTPRFIS